MIEPSADVAQSTARATPEAEEARRSGQYARALRRLIKRRQSIRDAAPFTAAIIAVAESWLYVNGVLCYIQERTLRVLNLHQSATQEVVIDVRALLDEAVAEPQGGRKYKFQLLYYAHGIVSCLFTRYRPDADSWLVIFNVHQRRIVTKPQPLESSYKIFVRNNEEYLYYGTHSEFGEDGFRRWVLCGYDIKADKWFDHKVHLVDMVGSDIGQSISFEIIDGYFYGLSNQTSFEIDEVDWTSYYHCLKFPVGQPQPKNTERSDKKKMWRRQHAEGPIDDRWSFIRLLKNEKDGRLQILESRKEWLDRRSSGQRTYYTTDLHFRTEPKGGDDGSEGGSSSNNSNNDDEEDDNINGHDAGMRGTILNPSVGDTIPPPHVHENWYMPTKEETSPRLRDPYNTHPGDDASTALLFTLSKCFIRSYHAPSQTFVDLVDNPFPHDPDSPRLQLRAGSRDLRPDSEIPRHSPAFDLHLAHAERIRHLYKEDGANKILFWPPACDEADEVRADPGALDQLNRVVNPPSHVGNVKGAWDDRSFVYSTGNNPDGVQALVFISFDPGMKLQGLRRWGDHEQESLVSTGRQEPTDMSTCNKDDPDRKAGGDVDVGGKGKEVELVEHVSESQATSVTLEGDDVSEDASQKPIGYLPTANNEAKCPSGGNEQPPEPRYGSIGGQSYGSNCNWAWTEPAMYREIGFGFNDLPDFTRCRQ